MILKLRDCTISSDSVMSTKLGQFGTEPVGRDRSAGRIGIAKKSDTAWDATAHFRLLPCECPFSLKKSALVLNCAVEQRLARQAHNLEVVGSIPTGAIQLARFSRIKPPGLPGGFLLRRPGRGTRRSKQGFEFVQVLGHSPAAAGMVATSSVAC
jgi:hypothetical protein